MMKRVLRTAARRIGPILAAALLIGLGSVVGSAAALAKSSRAGHAAGRSKSAAAAPSKDRRTEVHCQEGQNCQASASSPQSTFTISAGTKAGGGTLSVAVDAGTQLSCADYTPRDANWFAFALRNSSAGKHIVYTVTPSGKAPELVGGTNFCFGTTQEFITKAGTPAPARTLPDGTSGFIGLLPNCSAVPGGPCVDSRSTVPDAGSPVGFDIVVKVLIPAALPGDPWGRV
jgi:hypothetical protein